MKTEIGWILVRARGERILSLELVDTKAPEPPRAVAARLEAYFAGDLAALDALEVEPEGTDFQRRVWAELRKIRPGETISYGELARRIGRPRAVRACGRANATNPIGLVIPCHRVIGADGSLTGYAGGIERKRWLLEHERRYTALPAAQPVLQAAWKL
ncbi:MAG TPA: methylated-DNA--[protein]-cysteine S-methyltransferase [Planctomycetota bacterium]|nr:methylated-DNA--[protein]-cysteine S-methyltransferase [Planctomycetota bacterium]